MAELMPKLYFSSKQYKIIIKKFIIRISLKWPQVSCVEVCSRLCVCVCALAFCTLADLLPLLSVILHLFLTFSSSLFSSLMSAPLAWSERG